ncbi:MBL fold metallo-hydrolase [Mangrovivirga sp. M17]|uniref:MBL fold metallo-hydrolase n=1 Tax=Mangrovivirga halotolerans TaxID=2993936 RepID=A0ABT3RNK5_9BACT|nr:MBL fold metallo-hydrolase [Mangrovivirga halotolerans]MCX2743381.1 MBL fold metallo-hydrolase [Mangrovivirga halotolerans]
MIHILDLNFQNIRESIAAFAVETDNGPVLIETGPHSTYRFLRRALKLRGLEIKDVSNVLLTHIHLDHAGAAWKLAIGGADIHVHPKGSKHLANPDKLMESAGRIYGDSMDTLWGKMKSIPENQIKEVGDNDTISIGGVDFKALHTPGHASHHIAWQVNDSIFTGDVGGVKINNGPVVAPCPPPDINVEAWDKSIEVLREADPERLFLTHFGEVSGKENVKSHLDQLQESLHEIAKWIKPYVENGESDEKIIPEFQKKMHRHLKQNGATIGMLEQYEAANPSWMSVAGLKRYWKKNSAK